MAELASTPPALRPPSLPAQMAAVAALRWRIFLNAFRRSSGIGVGTVIAYIIMAPILLAILIGPTVGAFFASWFLVQHGSSEWLAAVLWGAFALTQIFNLNLGQPGTTLDPTDLLRFPIPLPSYVVLRLFFGILTPGNIMTCATALAVAAGATVGNPSLWWIAFPALFVFAVANLLFTRMVFAWIDRWLSTRRAREIFTGLIFALSLGFQWVNVTFNPGLNHRHHDQGFTQERIQQIRHLIEVVRPFSAALPPGLTASAITATTRHHPLAALTGVAATAAYGALFLAVFALRIRTEFQGESLSDTANAVREPARKTSLAHAAPQAVLIKPEQTERNTVLATVFGKELLTMRRNVGLFYGLVAPAVMVFLFAGRLSLRGNSPWLLPIATAYALLGVAPLSFNSFGLEGTGAQLYFFAPVRLREVFLAKNLMALLLGAFELALVIAIVWYVAAAPAPATLAFVLLWAFGTLLCTTTVGNFMSIRAPKKVNPGRTSRQAAPLSALLSMGIMVAAAAIGGGAMLAAQNFGLSWIPLGAAGAIAATGVLCYSLTLPTLERYAMTHRDSLFEELGKKM